jgi:WD40 repeat protein
MPDLTKPTLAWTLPWDADWVTAVAWVGRSRRLAAGNNLGGVLLWDLPDRPGGDAPKPIRRLDGHTNCVSRLASTPDGSVLLSASYDHTVRLWNPAAEPTGASETLVLNARAIADAERRKSNGARVPPANPAPVGVVRESRAFTGHREWVINLALTRDGRTVVSGDDGGHVLVWDREAATVRTRWQVKGWAYGLGVSPDGRQVCVGERLPLVFDSGRHAALKLWDATTGTMVRDLSADFRGQHIAAAAYSNDGTVLAVGRGGESDGSGPNVTLLDPTGAKKPRPLTPGHLNGVTDLAFHPDGKHLASCGRDTVVRVWDVDAGRLVSEVGKPRGGQFKDWIHAVSWSADGSWLAAADMAGAVQVWHFPG